ncbi:hypothetical protein BKA69DRAFT_1053522 [Paraphysoderma sedebokerense]|nr:hypothetical protein BKA69DRAFT_1053522 [Paraphysoderma sedebokerense]
MSKKQGNYQWRQSLGYNQQTPKFIQEIINKTTPQQPTRTTIDPQLDDGPEKDDEKPVVVIEGKQLTEEEADRFLNDGDLTKKRETEIAGGKNEAEKEEPVATKDGKLLFRKPKPKEEKTEADSTNGRGISEGKKRKRLDDAKESQKAKTESSDIDKKGKSKKKSKASKNLLSFSEAE